MNIPRCVELEGKGHGRFDATNGVDVLKAQYVHGTKTPLVRPHWDLEFPDGTVRAIEGGKDAALAAVDEILTGVMPSPMSWEETMAIYAVEGTVRGVVGFGLRELVENGPEFFESQMAARLSVCPLEIRSYKIVAVPEGQDGVWLRVEAVPVAGN